MPKYVPTYRPLPRTDTRPNSGRRGYSGAAWQRVRRAVIVRDGGACRHCGKLITQPGDAQVDHIAAKPTHEAATATPIEGLQLLCRRCHSIKTFAES
jgi:5-methylcytosine-specific restriction endonuclease McrA